MLWNRAPEMEPVDTLRSVPLFEGCTDEELRALDPLMTELIVPAGRRLANEGSGGLHFVIVAEGWAAVVRGQRVLGRIGPGSFFGEMSLLSSTPRTATITALTPMRLFVVNAGEFKAMTDAVPRVRARIEAAAAERRDATDRIAG